jgi:tetratricopeptide (TPR) repeat protein
MVSKRYIAAALFAAAFSYSFAVGSSGGGGGFSGSSAGGSGGGGGDMGGGAVVSSPRPSSAFRELYNAGYQKAMKGQYEAAIIDLNKAIALKADYAEAYNMLGFSTRKLGRINEAYDYYEKALQLKPVFPEALEYYGEAALQDDDLPRAVSMYISVLKQDKKIAVELLEKIDAYVNKGMKP